MGPDPGAGPRPGISLDISPDVISPDVICPDVISPGFGGQPPSARGRRGRNDTRRHHVVLAYSHWRTVFAANRQNAIRP